MQLKWIPNSGGGFFETRVFNNYYSVTTSKCWPRDEKPWMIIPFVGPTVSGFETKEEAMIAAHQIIEKELEEGYVGEDEFTSKLSYIPEDMFGCKKALALFTNANGDEYIDSVLISATIPKGSLVREVDPEHHDGLPADLGKCRKCRSDKAIIVDIMDPMYLRPGEIYSLPSCKTQRKKIPIISVHVVTEAIRTYFITQQDLYGYTPGRMGSYKDKCTIMRKLIQGFLSTILGFDIDSNARAFGVWLRDITTSGFPLSLDLAIAARLLDPYKDVVDRYKDDSYMFCKVLLARILRDIGIMDIALRQSYKIGDKIQIDDFDLNNNACGAGFHFFKTAIEAQNYKFN